MTTADIIKEFNNSINLEEEYSLKTLVSIITKIYKEKKVVKKVKKIIDEDENMILFTGKENIYSQHYKCNFIIDGITFNCSEQWMMYSKANLFLDEIMKEKILKSSNPVEMKRLGKKVKNFDCNEWEKVCDNVVYMGNLNKFTQNIELKEQLLNTGDKLIVEASFWDKRWGSGFNIMKTKEKLLKKEKIGENRLGNIIMKVRDELRK